MMPVPPVATAGGVSPSALISSWWKGASAAEAESVVAALPSETGLRGECASAVGTQTEVGRRIASRW